MHKLSRDDDQHEQIHERDDLHHQKPRSSLINTRQSSTILEAVARQVEPPKIKFVGLILTNLNSETDSLAATSHHDKVIDNTHCSQMMD